MKTARCFSLMPLLSALCLFTAVPASAQNLLTSGDFETVIDPASDQIPGWMLEEFVTGTGADVDSASQPAFGVANHDGEAGGRGLWLQAFNGGDMERNFVGINAILSQKVEASVGETYTFTGWSNFEANYSGGVDFLDSEAPIVQNGGSNISPTKSFFDLEFLDAGGSVLQTTTVDLVIDDGQFSGGGWVQHTVTGSAPANTSEVRVVARGLDMVENFPNPQSGFYDDFSLTTSSAPGTNLLENANLNIAPEPPPTPEEVLSEFFEFIETPSSANSITIAGFANDPATGGAQGVWIRPFIADSVSAEVKQIVDAVAGAEYQFSASARWERNFLGDDLSGANETLLQIAFLDDMDEIIETVVLDLRADDGKTAETETSGVVWSRHTVSGVAPEGTVKVAVSGITNMLTNNTVNGGTQSAFWDDFSLIAITDGLAGDFNNDGVVDAIDYALWRENLGGDESVLNGNGDGLNGVDSGDFNLWLANYGDAATGGGAGATPEPAALALAGLLLAGVGCAGRRRR